MLKLLPKSEIPPYEEFYTQNHSRVLHYVKGKLISPEEAEDLTSEVFLYCYSHYDSYDPSKSSLTTWLYLVVNSRLKNYYRDHVPAADFEEVAITLSDDTVDLDRGIYLEQLHSALMTALAQLPERQRQIVMLRYFENKSGEEIAQRLGISPGNVRVLLSRAVDKLAANKTIRWKEFMNNG